MYKTKNDLPEATRTNIIDLLNGRLADSIDLMLQTKQAHWNVKGSNFIALHEHFDEVADKVADYVDLIAERITQLGGIAEGTLAVVAQRSTLGPYPLTIAGGKEHVEALSTALAAFGKLVRRGSADAEEWQDRDTADLLTEVSRGIDKQLWFIEAHLQGKSGTRMAVANAKDPLH